MIPMLALWRSCMNASEQLMTQCPFGKRLSLNANRYSGVRRPLNVYSQHDVLILDINDSWPTLALIESVIAGEKEPVFACVLLDIVDYRYHSRSYLINYPSSSCHRMLKKHSDLHDYHPLSLHRCFDASCSWFHVILRQKLGYNNFACLI